jgi:uncharacterized membrane protein
VSKLLVLACLISFTTLLGVFARLFFVKSFLSYTDHVLQKIPVISAIYQASKEIVKSVFKSGPSSFSQVVLVPFPHPGIYALGLVSRPAPSSFFKTEGEALSVLILTTPNPTSGFLLMYKQTDLVYLDMKPEAAIKYIVSGGVLTPDMEPKK